MVYNHTLLQLISVLFIDLLSFENPNYFVYQYLVTCACLFLGYVCTGLLFLLYLLIQRRGTNIQNLIDSAGLESPSIDQISLKPHKGKGSLKGVKSSAGTTVKESDTEVSNLSCEDFMQWLMRKGYSTQDCQAFRGLFSQVIQYN